MHGAEDAQLSNEDAQKMLEANPAGIALREIQGSLHLNVPELELKDDLAMLKRLGLVETRGHGRGAAWFFINQGVEREVPMNSNSAPIPSNSESAPGDVYLADAA